MNKIFLVTLSFLVFISCSNKNSSKDSSSVKTGGTISIQLSSTVTSSPHITNNNFFQNSIINTFLTPSNLAAIGQTTSAGLTSLKYFITSIQICRDVTVQGTGYSNATNCIGLFSNNNLTDNYNNYTITDAMADNENYIDFMTEEGRAKFAQTITYTEDDIGDYNWVIVSFARPIKMTGSFFTPGTTTAAFITKTPQASELVPFVNEGREGELVRFTTNPTTGTPTELTYMLNNGGTYFPFLKPFSITQEDVDNKTSLSVEFLFNPNNFATVYQSTCDGTQYGSSKYNAVMYVQDNTGLGDCTFFDLPYAKMGAVPKKSGENIMKEVYNINVAEGTAKLRVELFYNSADTTKSVVGANSDIVFTSASVAEAYSNPLQTYKITQTNNDVTFYGYNSTSGQVDLPNFTFTRGVTTGTGSLNCNYQSSFCSNSDVTSGTLVQKQFTYTYEGEVLVGN